jgi:integrase
VGRGPGVSISELGDGRWRVRWREAVLDEATGERRTVQRERVVQDQSTAIELQGKVLRALETGAVPEVDAVRRIPVVVSVDLVIAGYLRARAARGAAPATITQYGHRGARALRAFRELGPIPESEPVPGTWLSREHLIELTQKLREDGLGDSALFATVSVLLQAWTWAADDALTFPGLAQPPRDPASVLPRAPIYAAARAPTMAECDAVIRRVAALPRAGVSLPVAVIARSTGLRVGQILALRVGDVGLASCTLAIRSGKSRLEKLGRVVPIASHLRDWLVELVADREAAEPLVRRRSDAAPGASAGTGSLSRAWEEASQADEVRREVWAPTNRVYGRPDHAFRAAFQHALVEAGIRDEVIDLLVGHARRSTRDRHYVSDDARWKAMVEAVALIPPVDWRVEAEAPSNVVPIRR